MSVWEDILSQAENLQHVVTAHAEQPRGQLDSAALLLKKANHVVFSGVGSGLNSCIPAVYYLMERGKSASYLDTTEAIYGLANGLRDAALVLNTRSGETIELIKLGQFARENHIPMVVVTNEPDSTVGKLADVCIPTYSRWDDLVVISAYGGLMVGELVLAAHSVGQLDAMLGDLHHAADAMGDFLERSIAERTRMLDLFKDVRPIYLLGRGPSLASALAGELVLEETSRRPAVAMATGLFRQGPLEVVDNHFGAIMFEGTQNAARLNALLTDKLLACGARLLWVGQAAQPGILSITLPALPGHILPLLEVIPTQILAHDLALEIGIEPGTVRYIQKVILTEEGLPNASK